MEKSEEEEGESEGTYRTLRQAQDHNPIGIVRDAEDAEKGEEQKAKSGSLALRLRSGRELRAENRFGMTTKARRAGETPFSSGLGFAVCGGGAEIENKAAASHRTPCSCEVG